MLVVNLVVGLVFSLLFRSENNLPKYLEIAVSGTNHKDLATARAEIFTFITELLTFAKKHEFEMKEYTLEILVCVNILTICCN